MTATPALPLDSEQLIEYTVDRIICELTCRSGFRQTWDECDDEIKADLRESFNAVIAISYPHGSSKVERQAREALERRLAEAEKDAELLDKFSKVDGTVYYTTNDWRGRKESGWTYWTMFGVEGPELYPTPREAMRACVDDPDTTALAAMQPVSSEIDSRSNEQSAVQPSVSSER